jgi:hypothetical protein
MGRKNRPVKEDSEETFEASLRDSTAQRGRGFGGRLVRRLFMMGVVLVAFLVAAPSIISTLGWTGSLVGPWLPKGMSLKVGSTDLAWWSPITIENLSVRTSDGALEIEIAKLTTSSTLFNLALSPRDWGTIWLESPSVMAKVVQEASKSEATSQEGVAADPAQEVDRLLADLRGKIEASGGQVQVEDGLGGRWSLEGVEGKVEISPDAQTAVAAEWKGSMAESKGSAVEGALAWSREKRAKGHLSASRFPLGMLNPFLAWNGDGARLSGMLTGRADFDYDTSLGRLQMKSEQRGTELVIASPAIEPDRLRLDSLEGRLSMLVVGSTIQIEQSDFRCDLGEASASGSMDLSKLSDPASQNLKVEGVVDVPTLAHRLPSLVRIREGVELESGQLAVSLRPAANMAGRWDALTEIRDFRASRGGKPVSWSKPVSLSATAGPGSDGEWVVDQFVCESDFLRAKGSGSLASFDVSAVCDLSRLQERLGELLDLGDTRLVGRVSGRIQSSQSPSGGIAMRGAAKGEDLEVRVAGETLLAERQLQAQFQLTAADRTLEKLIEGAIVLKNEREHLNCHLVEPVGDWKNGPWGTWDIQASGDLAELVRRADTVSTLFVDTKMAGVGVVSGRFHLTAASTRFEKLLVDVQGLEYRAPGLAILDQRVRMETSGVWNGEAMSLTLGPTSIIGQTVQCRADRLEGRLTDDGLAMVCQAQLAGDIGAIRRWTLPASVPVDVAGQFEGNVGLESDGKRWATTVNGTVNDLRYGAGEAPTIDEPRVELAGRASASIGGEDQGLLVQDFRVTVPGLAVTASGQVNQRSSDQVVELTGWMDYDWGTLSPRLRGLLGDQIVFEGRDRRAFRLSGPITSGAKTEFAAAREPVGADGGSTAVLVGQYPGLKGEFSLGWERARIYGFSAGTANIDGRLADSWVVTQPVSFPLNQGKVELRPGLFFGTKGTYLHHPAGRLADRITLTREMCEGAMQYIAPVLADSVDVRGLVSIDVEEVKVLIGHLEQADFRGVVRLEDAQATGSPLIRELLVLTDGQPVVEIAKESEIRFQVRQGRVYHEGLQLKLPGMVIETSGYVGLDRSLEMTAEMPIPPRWYPNERVRQQLAGQRIRVPIAGTLDKPRLDKQGFQRQVGQLVQESAGRLIEGELNKQIDKQLGRFLDKLK